MKKVVPSELKMNQALSEHPEVITEAYQTMLRAVGFPDPYGALKSLARGQKITLPDLHEWVRSLEHATVTEELRTPSSARIEKSSLDAS